MRLPHVSSGQEHPEKRCRRRLCHRSPRRRRAFPTVRAKSGVAGHRAVLRIEGEGRARLVRPIVYQWDRCRQTRQPTRQQLFSTRQMCPESGQGPRVHTRGYEEWLTPGYEGG